MRVVAGTARGKQLLVVPGHGTRPILDRVKTALFDVLRPRLEGMNVLDLFAGSGSVGIEALSQGAGRCTFIDIDHKAVAIIKNNLSVTGTSDRAVVHRGDSLAYLRAANTTATGSFDLIYVAPPQYKDLWIEAMRRITERTELLSSSGLVIVQIDPKEYAEHDFSPLVETRQKRYGNTLLVFYERREPE